MSFARRPVRRLVVVAAASFAAAALAYLLTPAGSRARVIAANLGLTWTAAWVVISAVRAWRAAPDPMARRAWGWVSAGCAIWFAAQFYWNLVELGLGRAPVYPSPSDLLILAMYPCFALALAALRPLQPRGLARDAETWLDTTLITYTAGALSVHFLLGPQLSAGGNPLAIATSIAGAMGAVGVIWLILLLMLRDIRVSLIPTGLLLLGLATYSLGDVIYAFVSLRGGYASGNALDFLWIGGLLTVAAAANSATGAGVEHEPVVSDRTPRLVAVSLGLVGILTLAVLGTLDQRATISTAVLIAIGGAIILLRFAYSLSADRRYAELLEKEVATQTSSLMDALAATAAAERNLRIVMEAVPDAIVVVDRDGRIVEVNPASRRTALPEETPGRTLFESLEPEAARLAREHLTGAFGGEVRRFEVPFVRADRTRGRSAVLFAPIRESGHVTRVLSLARDVTDQRRTEVQLQRAEKLAALGQLVSGVAHEINNPAAIISGFAQTLMLDDLTPEQREMAKMMYDEATRIGRITANLLAFARAGGRERALVDLNEMVRRTFALRAYHLTTLRITVNLELDPSDPHVWGNGSELQQMILNLVINAEQALEPVDRTRTITLRTGAGEDAARFEIADTGSGIAAEIRDKIFDPFFTTKPEGLGTGLGLSICYGIVHDHGGHITVDSEPGQGTVVVVTLPRDARLERRATAAPAAASADTPHSVLMVEEEAGLRIAVARYLNRRGVQVRAVSTAPDAFDALRSQEFDIIIADVQGISGREFLEHLRTASRGLVSRLILSGGDSLPLDVAQLVRESGARSIVKPYDLAALELLMREVVAAAAPKVSA